MTVTTDGRSVADELARAGGRKIRRYVNESIYRAAKEADASDGAVREFVCECGNLSCSEQVSMALSEFDASSRPGAIVGHEEEGPFPGPSPPDDPTLARS